MYSKSKNGPDQRHRTLGRLQPGTELEPRQAGRGRLPRHVVPALPRHRAAGAPPGGGQRHRGGESGRGRGAGRGEQGRGAGHADVHVLQGRQESG